MRLTEAEIETALNEVTIARGAIQLIRRQPTAVVAPIHEPLGMASRSLDRLSHHLIAIRSSELTSPELSSDAVNDGRRPRHFFLRLEWTEGARIIAERLRRAANALLSVHAQSLALRVPIH